MANVHPWLKQLDVAWVSGPEPASVLLEQLMGELLDRFRQEGHTVQHRPDPATDVILTTAPFGRPISWRDAAMFTARRRFGIDHSPLVYTFVHADPHDFAATLAALEKALSRDDPDPADYDYPGLARNAYRVLHEQGARGGPILALERLVQAQAKSIRVALVVGEDEPAFAHHFDLAGAHPRTEAVDRSSFAGDIVLRIATAASTEEVTEHEAVDCGIPPEVFARLSTPRAMRVAGEELGRRRVFTDPVVIADLVKVPVVAGTVESQYSEGCYATWDPEVEAMVATATGSARPLHKGKVTENDLTVIVGLRSDGKGARVCHMEGRANPPPSSEAVEMAWIDEVLPRIRLDDGKEVPVVRSKLHAHRGIGAFDPTRVEHLALDEPYYHYLVSCASKAQALGVKAAFSRSEALSDPGDSRIASFVVLPGHGVVIAEKWLAGTQPFQLIWELMDEGAIQMISRVPQGPFRFRNSGGSMVLEDGSAGPAGMPERDEPRQ